MMSRTTEPSRDRHGPDESRTPPSSAEPDRPRREALQTLAAGAAAGAGLAFGGGAFATGTMNPARNAAEVAELPRFADRHVLITGATSGIGEATARAFAAEGATVTFCGRRAELGASVAASINEAAAAGGSGGGATYVRCDVRDAADVERFVKEATARVGRLDIAFNNAGSFMPPKELQELTVAEYLDLVNTNLNGVAYAMMHELPVMQDAGRGVIVNMASVAGNRGFGNTPHYCASKHGVIGLTRAVAAANAGRNIRVASLSPLAVDTPMLEASFAYQGITQEAAAPTFVTPRIMAPVEMARAVMFLADPSTTYLTGTDLDVTGGQLA